MEEVFYNGCLCPVCEIGSLNLVSRDEEFVYKGNKIVLSREVWECSECKEFFFQAKDRPEIEKILTDRRRRVDGLLVSEEIKSIREQLHMTTAELAEILRISEKHLVYYENGQDSQSYELDDLLRILRKHSEALDVLKQECKDTGKKHTKRRSKTSLPILTEEKTPQPVGA